jgi:predicted secreted hydrolase
MTGKNPKKKPVAPGRVATVPTGLEARRHMLLAAGSLLLSPWPALAGKPDYAAVLPERPLRFPQDFGAHPDFRTEWWYVTGWLQSESAQALGFQVTFFRSRSAHSANNPSRFAPRQLIIAHAALSDPRAGKLLHDQKSARAGFDLAYAREGDTDVMLNGWQMKRAADGHYDTRIQAHDFSLELQFKPTQPLLLQGEAGYSRKGPRPEQASYYYSEPQLQVRGRLSRQGKPVQVEGRAWLDHEWSSSVLDERASGWDWVGANLDDGSALMMFRIRDGAGKALWAHASLRDRHGQVRNFASDEVSFEPTRSWRSPRTGASYPVAGKFRTGDLQWELAPLQDDQELDSRLSTGSVYWEGAVSITREGKPLGRGYLELTGYHKALKL